MVRWKKIKPTATQKAIITLLSLIDKEGLDYGACDRSVPKLLKEIGDENLSVLVLSYIKVAEALENHLVQLESEVQPFREDEDEF